MPSISKSTEKAFYALALARISLGFIFLWAFFDKLFGLGFATCRNAVSDVVTTGCAQAWSQGGSPTTGFLEHATQGPLASFYQGLAGQGWVDWAFMLGLLGIGLGLLLGIGVRLAALGGALMMLLMWSAALWPENNPALDDHVVYIFVLLAILYGNTQQKWGLRSWWANTPLVKRAKFLE